MKYPEVVIMGSNPAESKETRFPISFVGLTLRGKLSRLVFTTLNYFRVSFLLSSCWESPSLASGECNWNRRVWRNPVWNMKWSWKWKYVLRNQWRRNDWQWSINSPVRCPLHQKWMETSTGYIGLMQADASWQPLLSRSWASKITFNS